MDHFPDPFASLYPLHHHAGDLSFWSATANGAMAFGRSIFQAVIGGLIVGAVGYLILVPSLKDDVAVMKAQIMVLQTRAEFNATENAKQTRELELRAKQHDAEYAALEHKIESVERELRMREVNDQRRYGR